MNHRFKTKRSKSTYTFIGMLDDPDNEEFYIVGYNKNGKVCNFDSEEVLFLNENENTNKL